MDLPTDQAFDLLIIGGGIIGCGIARDAALRGLRVALFEKEDFGCGTSSRSTRLIHGGLRYLEMLDFGLVRQDLRERETLLKIAPHRVRPLPFLVPFYHRSLYYRARLWTGMVLYDLLSYDKSLPHHRMLNRQETLQIEPGLSSDGLQGAARYYDAQVALPERLCIDNITDAKANGALAFNHTEVTGLLRGEQGRIAGATVRDTQTGETADVSAEAIINAAGPWLDSLLGRLTGQPRKALRLTKGIHFAAPPAVQNALVLFAQDARLFFVIPWLDYAWVGTTDTDFQGDLDRVHATGEEVRYLLASVRKALPEADWNTIYFTNAGVRALVRDDRPNARESEVSRQHRLKVHTEAEGLDGLISVLGGKLTAYRAIAEEAVDAVYGVRNQKRVAEATARGERLRLVTPPSLTASRPLPGGDFANEEQVQVQARCDAETVGLDAEQADHLVFLYGTRYTQILSLIQDRPELGSRIADAYPDVKAQIVHAVEQESARTAADFLMRRAMLAFTADQGQAALEPVVANIASLLRWDTERRQAELAAYRAQVSLTQAFRQE